MQDTVTDGDTSARRQESQPLGGVPTSNTVGFNIHPTVSLVDAPLHIQLEGLRSSKSILIRARRLSKNPGISLESYGLFMSDGDGRVNLDTKPPLEGTYSEADGMGLLWSMKRIETPGTAGNSMALSPLNVTFAAECEGEVVAQATIERTWVPPGVQRTPVRDNEIVGTYFHGQKDRPRPGIVVFGGSEGGLNESVAAVLSSHGYSTLALAYFGIEHLPPELVNIPLEYIESAIDWFVDQPGVCSHWIGLHGTSKGGELALLAASMFPKIKAVVCVSSGGVVLHGIQAKGTDKLPPSWTYRGQPISYASDENPYHSGKLTHPTSNVVSYRSWYEAHVSNEDVLRKSMIPVERIQGSILFISGKDDQMLNSERLSQLSVERLKQLNHPYSYEHYIYPEAGHSIGIPYLPSATSAEVPGVGKVWAFGGSLSGNARASVDSWSRILDFFGRESGNLRQ